MALITDNRYFLRFFLSRLISRIGDGVHSLALLWLAYKWSGKASVVALVMISFSLPAILVSPFAGSLADRKPRQKIMSISDLVQAACTALLAILASMGKLNILNLMLITVVMSVASAYFLPASMSIIPQIVKKEDITRANGLVQLSSTFSIVIGPLIGVGLIAAIGIPLAFAANSFSFVASSLLLIGIKTLPIEITQKSLSIIETIKDGFATVRKYPIASKFLDKEAVINFFVSAITIIIPIAAGSVYHMGSKGIGLMMSSYGAGMFISSVLLGSIRLKTSPRNIIVSSILALGVIFALFAMVKNFYLSLLCLFLIGFFLNVTNVNIISLWQSNLPNNVLGRIMSFVSAISMSLSPLSYAVTGLLIELMGIKWVLITGGAFILLNGFMISRIKELKEAQYG